MFGTLMGLLFGGLSGTGLAFAREYVLREREENPKQFLEVTNLRRSAVNRLMPKKIRQLAVTVWPGNRRSTAGPVGTQPDGERKP